MRERARDDVLARLEGATLIKDGDWVSLKTACVTRSAGQWRVLLDMKSTVLRAHVRWRAALLLGSVLALATVAAGLMLERWTPLASDDPRLPLLVDLVVAILALTAGAAVARLGPRYVRTWRVTRTVVDAALLSVAVWLLGALALAGMLGLTPAMWLLVGFGWPHTAVAAVLGGAIGAASGVRRQSAVTKGRRPNRSGLLREDRPHALGPGEDLLHRQGVLDLLVETLREQRINRGSLVVALDGPWGAGKTTVLKTVEAQLSIEHPSDYIVVNFDPWDYDRPTSLLASFFASLSEAVGRRYLIPDFEREASRYVAALNPSLAKLGFTLDPLRRRDVDLLRRALSNLTRCLPAHLVVILDDLDRLQRDDLLATLRLMKLSADLENLTYLVALNVRHASEHLLKDQGDSYLDKFLDVVIPLTVVDPEDLAGYGADRARAILRAANPAPLRGADAIEDSLREHVGLLPTIRDVNRVLNNFGVALRQLSGEVNVGDVLLLEILRWRAPTVWLSVHGRPEFFIASASHTRGQAIAAALRTVGPEAEAKWQSAREEYYRQVRESAPAERGEAVFALLRDVFPYVATDRGTPTLSEADAVEQRVRHPDYFRRYFLQRLPSRVVSDARISSLIAALNALRVTAQQATNAAQRVLDQLLDEGDDAAAAEALARFALRVSEIDEEMRRPIAHAIGTAIARYEVHELSFTGPVAAAAELVLRLVLQSSGEDAARDLLDGVFSDSPSLPLLEEVVQLAQDAWRRRYGFEAEENVSRHLQASFDARLATRLGGGDLLALYPTWWKRLLYNWSDRNAKQAYLEDLSRQSVQRFDQIMAYYVGGRRSGSELDLEQLQRDWDQPRLCRLVNHMCSLPEVLDQTRAALGPLLGWCADANAATGGPPADASKPSATESKPRRSEHV